MSAIVDCPACQNGNHHQHVGPWHVMEGVIGGATCGCTGGCAERYEKTAAYLRGMFTLPPPSGNTDTTRASSAYDRLIAERNAARADLATARTQLDAVEALRNRHQAAGPGLVTIGELDAALAVPDSKKAGK